MIGLEFGGVFWPSVGELDIAMDSSRCKEAMRLGFGSMHGVLSELGGGGGSEPPRLTSTVCVWTFFFAPPLPPTHKTSTCNTCNTCNICNTLQVLTSNAFMIGALGVLTALTVKLGVAQMAALYLVPYWGFVCWLDAVTYL
jgi:hypothetical protein